MRHFAKTSVSISSLSQILVKSFQQAQIEAVVMALDSLLLQYLSIVWSLLLLSSSVLFPSQA
jgi:hypothetical protein